MKRFVMKLTRQISNHNLRSFLWHATFLAFAKNFMDVDTIIPSMLVDAGGGAVHIGIMAAIMMGGSSFTQLFFAPYLSNKRFKKGSLLTAINIRVSSLAGLGGLLFLLTTKQSGYVLPLAFIFITLFALAGAFANIGYTDILGKSVLSDKRKTFFSSIQIISGVIVLGSSFFVKSMLSWKEYPENYAFMFFTGAGFLLIATAGFWNIKEVESSKLKINGFKDFIKILKRELKHNKRLGYFLGYINTQGVVVSLLPFIILYAREHFNTHSSDAGTFLMFKVMGTVFVSVLIFMGAKKIRYNVLLFGNVILSLLLVSFVFFITEASMLKYIFILGGTVFSLFSMSLNGLLLEVSGKENRALYTGFAGAGNILPAVVPIAGGTVIHIFGYNAFFIMFMLIISSALFFIIKIDCKK